MLRLGINYTCSHVTCCNALNADLIAEQFRKLIYQTRACFKLFSRCESETQGHLSLPSHYTTLKAKGKGKLFVLVVLLVELHP